MTINTICCTHITLIWSRKLRNAYDNTNILRCQSNSTVMCIQMCPRIVSHSNIFHSVYDHIRAIFWLPFLPQSVFFFQSMACDANIHPPFNIHISLNHIIRFGVCVCVCARLSKTRKNTIETVISMKLDEM